jgi:hypothetical protein
MNNMKNKTHIVKSNLQENSGIILKTVFEGKKKDDYITNQELFLCTNTGHTICVYCSDFTITPEVLRNAADELEQAKAQFESSFNKKKK